MEKSKQNHNMENIDSTKAWLGMMIVLCLILFTTFCYSFNVLYGHTMILFDVLFGYMPVLEVTKFVKACIKNKINK